MKLYAIGLQGLNRPTYYYQNPGDGRATDLGTARKFSTPGDASAWMYTQGVDPASCAVVPVPPAAMLQAEAAARADWIGRGGKVQMGEATNG